MIGFSLSLTSCLEKEEDQTEVNVNAEYVGTFTQVISFERDMNGKVVNEVKLYKAKRKLLEEKKMAKKLRAHLI